jgi:hypothetical protein
MDRMKSLSEAIRTLVEGEFSGYLKINFTQGSLGRIEKSEEFDAAKIITVDAAMKQAGGGTVKPFVKKRETSHETAESAEEYPTGAP